MAKVSIVFLVLFLILTFFAKSYPFFIFDILITTSLQNIDLPFFVILMEFLTLMGNFYQGLATLILIIIFFIALKKYKEALMVFISTSGAVYLSEVFKSLVERPRPDPELVIQAGKFSINDSFPSGHVLFAIGLYGFLLYLTYVNLKKGLFRNFVICFLAFVIFLMGLSRIYLGAHWFSDTLGSYLIGVVWITIIAGLFKKLAGKI